MHLLKSVTLNVIFLTSSSPVITYVIMQSVCVCMCVYPRWGNSPIALQPCSVPDLSFDDETVQLNSPRAELHTDSGTTIVIELILREASQKVALSYSRLTY